MANEGLLIETLESSAIHKYSLRQVIFVHKGLFFLAIINILFLFFMSLKARVIFRTLKKIIYGIKENYFVSMFGSLAYYVPVFSAPVV